MAEAGGNRGVCRKCCQSFMTMLFSTLGLIILIVTYTVIGGFLFQKLEATAEEGRIAGGRRAAEEIRKNYSEQLWNITFNLNILQKSNWTDEVKDVLKQFEESVYNVTKQQYWDGKTDETAEIVPHWSFAGSMLYSLTAITTIGYGHVAPKTREGQLLTILYCIIGLPLTLMCIAKLGKAFAYVFRVIYYTCCCAICCLCCIASRQKRASRSRRGSDVLTSHLAALVIVKDAPGAIKLKEKRKEDNLGHAWWKQIKLKYNKGLNHDNAVPTSLCLLVMAAYIAGGGVLFAQWEKEWDIQEGAYFCFITLTTIGFGDYVPGVDKLGSENNRNQNLVLCALYVFIGLAFIGMCIDLMQVDVINKVKWLGKTLGISETKKRKTQSDHKKARVGEKLSASDPPPAMSTSATCNSLAEKLTHDNSYHNLGIPTMSECNGVNGPMSESMRIMPYLLSTTERQKIKDSTSEPCTPLLPNFSPQSPSSSFLSAPPTYNSCNSDRQSEHQSESDGSYKLLHDSSSDDIVEEQQVETVIS